MMLDKLHYLTIQASIKNIHTVERFVENICDYYNINTDYFGHILTAVTEAVENAIFHGNNNNLNKKVFLRFDITPEGYIFRIKDEGAGFNLDAVPDPTDYKADFSKTEGRGLFIIKTLADVVNFYDNGACVELIFKISSITKQMSDDRINTYMSNIKSKQDVVKHKETE